MRDVTNIMDIVLSFTPSLLLHVPRSVQLSTTTCEPSCQNRGWLHTWRCCFFISLSFSCSWESKQHIFWWAATFVVFTVVQPKFNRNTSVYMFTCSTTEPPLCVYWQHIKTLPWQYLCTKPVDSVSSRHRNAFAFSATYWRMWQSKIKIHKTSLWWFEIEKILVAVIGVLPVMHVSVMWSQF